LKPNMQPVAPEITPGSAPLIFSEAAEYLRMSEKTLGRLMAAGHIHPVRFPGTRRWLFPRAELDRALAEIAK
jgi:excisionase family DNA binding protein